LLSRPASARLGSYGLNILCLSIVGLAAVTGASEKPAYTRTPSTVTVPVNNANIALWPLEDGAIRVQIAAPGETPAPESVVFIHTAVAPRFTVRETPRTILVDTGALQASVNRENGALTFADADGNVLLQEKEGSRIIPPPDTPAAGTTAQDAFLSPQDEYLFGTGQFQDGYLNVRGLPRRLTQVNSQIAIPFLLSSKGYGLLWHNYGLTDLNPADTEIRLTQTSVGAAQRADVTTSSGTQTEQTREAVFSGEFDVKAGGPHALMLDVGQKMARRYHVEIDGKPEVDFANY
jgi:alpha-D-xyloside xylohydrolase